jgi:hypothetical protein
MPELAADLAAADPPSTDGAADLDVLATDWLEAEARTRTEPANEALDAAAGALSDAYAAAVAGASVEELRLAWEAAVRRQGEQEVGSVAWADARRVSELLRAEYLAARG